MNKTHVNKPNHVKQTTRPKEEHIVREHAHEPIISREDFDIANQMIRRSAAKCDYSRYIPVYEPSILAGKLFCEHCGLVMEYREESMTAVCKYHYRYQTSCNNTVYSLPVLEDYIYYKLKPLLQQTVAEKEAQEASVRQAGIDLKECQRQIVFLKRRQETLLQEKRRLFEAFSAEELTLDGYSVKKKEYRLLSESIQAELDQKKKDEETLSSLAVDPNIAALAQKAAHYLSEGGLTRDMVTDYIESVKVYDLDDYRITWRYPELFRQLQEKYEKRR